MTGQSHIRIQHRVPGPQWRPRRLSLLIPLLILPLREDSMHTYRARTHSRSAVGADVCSALIALCATTCASAKEQEQKRQHLGGFRALMNSARNVRYS